MKKVFQKKYLILIIFFLCVILLLSSVRFEKQVHDRVDALGGEVMIIDYSFFGVLPNFCRSFIHKELRGEIVVIQFHGKADLNIDLLNRLDALEQISFYKTDITDDDLRKLKS